MRECQPGIIYIIKGEGDLWTAHLWCPYGTGIDLPVARQGHAGKVPTKLKLLATPTRFSSYVERTAMSYNLPVFSQTDKIIIPHRKLVVPFSLLKKI